MFEAISSKASENIWLNLFPFFMLSYANFLLAIDWSLVFLLWDFTATKENDERDLQLHVEIFVPLVTDVQKYSFQQTIQLPESAEVMLPHLGDDERD